MKAKLLETLQSLFSLGGNHNTDKLLELRKHFLRFLSEEEQIFLPCDDENLVVAKDAIRFIDAQIEYAHSDCKVKAGSHVQPLFERLLTMEKWGHYEVKLLVGSLHLANDLTQTLLLAETAIAKLRNLKSCQDTDYLVGSVAFNTLSRILHTKFYEEHAGLNLEDQFANWLINLKYQAPKNPRLNLYLDVARIKQAVFSQDVPEINRLMEQFKKKYEEDIITAFENEINYYMRSERYMTFYREKLQGGGAQ